MPPASDPNSHPNARPAHLKGNKVTDQTEADRDDAACSKPGGCTQQHE